MTEQFPSCLIDRAQRTELKGFVIQDNSQSLNFLEMIVVDIQQLEGMTDQIHKYLHVVFIDLRCLSKRPFAIAVESEGCITTRECVKHR